jgi:hypothetical protein
VCSGGSCHTPHEGQFRWLHIGTGRGEVVFIVFAGPVRVVNVGHQEPYQGCQPSLQVMLVCAAHVRDLSKSAGCCDPGCSEGFGNTDRSCTTPVQDRVMSLWGGVVRVIVIVTCNQALVVWSGMQHCK